MYLAIYAALTAAYVWTLFHLARRDGASATLGQAVTPEVRVAKGGGRIAGPVPAE
jgi:hypothetical protein